MRGAMPFTTWGHLAPVGAGEYSFGADQDCITTPDGKRGHLSAQVGDETNVQLIIQRNDDAWRGVKPGFFS